MRVEMPRIFWDGRKRDIPEPDRGLLKSSETFRERRRNERMIRAGTASSNKLCETYLGTYKWYVLNVQSTIPGRTQTEMPPYTLSPSNSILDKTIEIARTEQAESSRTKPGEIPQLRTGHQEGVRPAKRGRPGSYTEGRKREGHLTVTRVFRESLTPTPARKPALERLEPPIQLEIDLDSDNESKVTSARKTSSARKSSCSSSKDRKTSPARAAANRSRSDDDEPMFLDPWDVPPAAGSPGSSTAESSPSSDSEGDERAIQALVEKVAATVRAEFLRDKEEKKKRKKIERKQKDRRN